MRLSIRHEIAIVSIVRNDFLGIKRTLESVVPQLDSSIEYIIIDGLSSDGTVAVIFNFLDSYGYTVTKSDLFQGYYFRYGDTQITLISERDKGIYNAMNKGLSIARAEYVAFVNSGDFLESNILSSLIAKICADEGRSVDMYYGLVRIFSENGFHLKTAGSTLLNITKEMIAHPTCFIKKALIDELGGFNENYKSAADFDLLLKISKQSISAVFIEEVIANFYLGGVSSTSIGSFESMEIKYKHGFLKRSQYVINYLVLVFKKVLKI